MRKHLEVFRTNLERNYKNVLCLPLRWEHGLT